MSSPIYSPAYYRNILLGLILALGIFIVYELKEIFSSILGAIVLYTLFKPMYLRLSAKAGKPLAAVTVIIISLLIIVIPFVLVTLMIIGKVGDFSSNPDLSIQIVRRINEFAARQFHDPQFMQHKLNDIQQWILHLFSDVANSVFKSIFSVAVMYFILYFMLAEHEPFEKNLLKFIPFRQRSTRLLGTELRNITRSNIVGQSLIAVAQAICVTGGFLVFKIPDAYFWGFVAAFLSFIPIFGVPSMFLGAAAYSFITDNTFAGIGMIVWGFIVIAFIENYLRLYMGRKLANAHPLITVIGVLIGIPTFGIVGIVFGPLLLSYFILLISMYESKYRSAEELEAKK